MTSSMWHHQRFSFVKVSTGGLVCARTRFPRNRSGLYNIPIPMSLDQYPWNVDVARTSNVAHTAHHRPRTSPAVLVCVQGVQLYISVSMPWVCKRVWPACGLHSRTTFKQGPQTSDGQRFCLARKGVHRYALWQKGHYERIVDVDRVIPIVHVLTSPKLSLGIHSPHAYASVICSCCHMPRVSAALARIGGDEAQAEIHGECKV